MEAVTVTFGFPERYFDGDAQAFRYRQRRYETWRENGVKMGRWEWVPAFRNEQAMSKDRPTKGAT